MISICVRQFSRKFVEHDIVCGSKKLKKANKSGIGKIIPAQTQAKKASKYFFLVTILSKLQIHKQKKLVNQISGE